MRPLTAFGAKARARWRRARRIATGHRRVFLGPAPIERNILLVSMSVAEISVIIPVYNEPRLARCLDGLFHQTLPRQRYEVLVVDNGSMEDPTSEIRQKHPWALLMRSDRNLGFTGGNNWGIRVALERNAKYLLLLNNDATISPGAVTELVRACQGSANTSVAGPKIKFHDRPDRIQSAGFVVRDGWAFRLRLRCSRIDSRGAGELDDGQFDKPGEVDGVSGCAMFLPRDVVESIGLLEERLFVYWEDAEYCLRARQAGFRCLYVPKAVVWHKGSMSTGPELWRTGEMNQFQLYMSTRNRHLVMRRYCGLGRFLYQWGLLTLRTGLNYLKSPRSLGQASPWFWGSIDGLMGRTPQRFSR